jgi:hypothetical protein
VRTTLTIDDDVLAAAKEIAHAERRATGAVLSDLARGQLLARNSGGNTGLALQPGPLGFPVLPSRGGIVTNQDVAKLRDELGI